MAHAHPPDDAHDAHVAHSHRAHDPAHDHGHSHAHGHVHAPASFGRAFAVGISLNLAFVVIEAVYGVVTHSMALFADAGHNLSDVLGLGLAWGATVLSQRRPSSRRTYGMRGTTILASLTNAVILLLVTGGILWESVRRVFSPAAIGGKTVIVVALIGVAVNAISALLFLRGGDKNGDLNIRGAFLHLASDAVLAFGVAIAGAVIVFTGWLWVDPAVSIVLAVTILIATWSLLKRSLNLVLDAVPEGIDPEDIRTFLGSLAHVQDVHDLHIWAMSTTETALTAHLVMPLGIGDPCFLSDACKALHEKYKIDHATLQVDPADAPFPCKLAPEEVV